MSGIEPISMFRAVGQMSSQGTLHKSRTATLLQASEENAVAVADIEARDRRDSRRVWLFAFALSLATLLIVVVITL